MGSKSASFPSIKGSFKVGRGGVGDFDAACWGHGGIIGQNCVRVRTDHCICVNSIDYVLPER
jgi:hypothetical protein